MALSNSLAIVVGELSRGELASHTVELVTAARTISENVVVVVSAKDTFDSTQASLMLGEYGAKELHVVNVGSGLSGAALARYISNIASAYDGSNVILSPQTYLGRDVASHVSVYLDVDILSNAVGVEADNDALTTHHAIFGGTKIATATSSGHNNFVVLVRPKSFVPESGNAVTTEVITAHASDLVAPGAQTTITSSEVVASEGPELEDAAIVITGGRGLGTQENYEALIGGTAEVLGAATGASRAIVDAGWVPYSKQVGQTGKTVKPDVYIACGVSGATQHLVGMKGSKNIIAINTDDQAPIFTVADLGIVGDVNVVLPQVIEKLKAKKS